MIFKAICPHCGEDEDIQAIGEVEIEVYADLTFNDDGTVTKSGRWEVEDFLEIGHYDPNETGNYYCAGCAKTLQELAVIGGDEESIEYLANKADRESLNAEGQQDLFEEPGE